VPIRTGGCGIAASVDAVGGQTVPRDRAAVQRHRDCTQGNSAGDGFGNVLRQRQEQACCDARAQIDSDRGRDGLTGLWRGPARPKHELSQRWHLPHHRQQRPEPTRDPFRRVVQVCQRRPHGLHQLLSQCQPQSLNEVIGRGEVVVEGPPRHPRRLHDVIDRGGPRPLGAHDLQTGKQKRLAHLRAALGGNPGAVVGAVHELY
jgi:hypothetical protein